MAKYNEIPDSGVRKALIDFIGSYIEDQSDKEQEYTSNLNFRAIANDVTGSLGVWGITHR